LRLPAATHSAATATIRAPGGAPLSGALLCERTQVAALLTYCALRRYGTQGGGWGRNAGVVVFDERSSFNGRVSVTEHPVGDGRGTSVWRVLRFGVETRQSVALVGVDTGAARPDVLAMEYTKAVAAHVLGLTRLLAAEGCRVRVLCLGGGAGSLPLFLAAFLPQAHVDVVEIDAVVVAAARLCGFDAAAAALGNVHVHVTSAQDFLSAGSREAYDVVVVDCFTGDDGVPRELLQQPFLGRLRAHLRASGSAVLMNAHGGQLAPLRVDEAIATVGRRLRGQGEDTSSRQYRGYEADSADGRHLVACGTALAEALDAVCWATRVDGQGNVVLTVVVGAARPDKDALEQAAMKACQGAPFDCAAYVNTGLHVVCACGGRGSALIGAGWQDDVG